MKKNNNPNLLLLLFLFNHVLVIASLIQLYIVCYDTCVPKYVSARCKLSYDCPLESCM